MSKPNKTCNIKYYIIGVLLSYTVFLGFMGIGYYLRLVFTRLSFDQLGMISLLCLSLGLFFGEAWNHSKTKKELKDLKKSIDKQEQSTD